MSRDFIVLGTGVLSFANTLAFSRIRPNLPTTPTPMGVALIGSAIAAISLLAMKYSKEDEKPLSLSDYITSIGATLVGGALGLAIALTVEGAIDRNAMAHFSAASNLSCMIRHALEPLYPRPSYTINLAN